jgi:hypothetical protein
MKHNWRIAMSLSWFRLLGLIVVSASLAAGCGGAKKIDVGGACILNSDCNQALVCTWGKCHVACHTSADCQPGQSCIIASAQSTVCESPTGCIYNSDCPTGSLFAAAADVGIGAYLSAPGLPLAFFHGEIDEISLYNRALTAAEVQSVYVAGAAGKCRN